MSERVRRFAAVERDYQAHVSERDDDVSDLRQYARAIVDEAWNECTDSSEVPATEWADRMIDRVTVPASLAAAERERAAADALASSCEEHEPCPVHPHGSHADADPPCIPCQHDRTRATLIRLNLAAYRAARGAR